MSRPLDICPIINFTIYDNIKHVKLDQHNHTQSRYNNNYLSALELSNANENEFLIEFSGYNEVIEL